MRMGLWIGALACVCAQGAAAASLETSVREKISATSVAFRGNRPKANDEIWESEVRAVLRTRIANLDIKIEAAALTDRFNHRPQIDTDQFRGVVEIMGACFDGWSCGVEWRPRYTYQPWFDEPLLRQNYGGVKAKRRWSETLMGLKTDMLLTANFGYAESWPAVFRRASADAELEATVRLDGVYSILIAPKLEVAAYPQFFGLERNEIASSIRIAPRADLGGGLSLSLEAQYQATNSTRQNKDGEVWSLTPILRMTAAW
jgi:hypothetical protein